MPTTSSVSSAKLSDIPAKSSHIIRVLHTADWHLGKKLGPHARLAEQVEVLDEICKISKTHDVDIVVIAGDCFDQLNPDTASIRLFYKTLHELARGGETAVVVIAGNHDSAERIDAPSPLAEPNNIYMIGSFDKQVHCPEQDHFEVQSKPGVLSLKKKHWDVPIRLFATPYVNELRLKKELKSSGKDARFSEEMKAYWAAASGEFSDPGFHMLVTHLLFVGQHAEAIDDQEKPIIFTGGTEPLFARHVPASMHYTALGHLHRHQEVSENIWYSGSPLAYSFSESFQEKFVNILDIDARTCQHTVHPQRLSSGFPLLRKECHSVQDACEWLENHQHAYVELTLSMPTFLTLDEQQSLASAHPRCQIVPNIDVDDEKTGNRKMVDINQSMDALFKSYVQQTKHKSVNTELLDMFHEVLAKSKQ